MATPKEHIEAIRRNKFSIGGPPNPLTLDFHHAVDNLSAELYAKDVHFLMELIQNAEDNEYSASVKPSFQFIVTSQDVTQTGASTTLVILNNETGFSSNNIDSICSVGRSTKTNKRKRGYIGEKGIGFKSVFLITSQPYIFSNGYQIRFNEHPCSHCGVGYVVPEWVEEDPVLSNIKKLYGDHSQLPTTTIVLPLKPDKIKSVKQQLSSIHPEILLFLSKIKQLSYKEANEEPKSNSGSEIAIFSETDFLMKKNIHAESYTLHLSSLENDRGVDSQCSYYMWKQKFPVHERNRVKQRMGVEELVITLAFPHGERLSRGLTLPGVYAFLPTEMVTNFPFIIQADFVLSSSRENILLDNKWNQGILDCVPSTFVNAFVSLVRTTDEAPLSSLAHLFNFLPIISSSYEKLNVVRDLIKKMLLQQHILPGHSFLKRQRFFHKPCEVGRIMPPFWNILMKAHEQGLSLLNLSSHGKYILSSSFDKQEYNPILSFLDVKPVDDEWYAKCLLGTNIVEGVSDDVYVELLQFVADKWSSRFHGTNMKNVPLIRYVDLDGNVSLRSVSQLSQSYGTKVHLGFHDSLSWLNKSNIEFKFVSRCFFMPESTQKCIRSCSKKDMLLQWLQEHVKVCTIRVFLFAKSLANSLGNNNAKHVVMYVHFLYHSLSRKYLNNVDLKSLCSAMPVVDKYGAVIKHNQKLLIPADGSKWAELFQSNPWENDGFVELGGDYISPVYFAGESITTEQLTDFLRTHMDAFDIPDISPPNTEVSVFSSPLTMQNVILLLDWIRSLKARRLSIPCKFLKCIKEGCWLRVTVNGSPGYRPPSESFDLSMLCKSILENGSILVDIPLIDHKFYADGLQGYKEELKTIGVMFENKEVLDFIGSWLMSSVTVLGLKRENVFNILEFIRFLRKRYSGDDFIASMRKGTWLKTCHGYISPVGSVLYSKEWEAASVLSNIPFIDEDYYGDEIRSFREELKSLGVEVDFQGVSQLIVDHLKSPSQLTCLRTDAFLLILKCLSERGPKLDEFLVNSFKSVECVKTNLGYRPPGECYLSDLSWTSILQVFTDFPLVDCEFYGSQIINSYKWELKKMGVMVGFEEAIEAISKKFREHVVTNSLTKESAILFLSSFKQLKERKEFLSGLKNICELNWLRTRLGDHRSPKNCILYDPSWESVSAIALLPFIDDSRNYYGNHIHEYEEELKNMGVITDLKDGAYMIAAGLCLPQNPVVITSENMLSLLDCIRILMEKKYSFQDDFYGKVSQRWLKTSFGYMSPEECLLFTPKWSSYLKPTDGPFIDEEFYTFNINLYEKELKEIGVIVNVAHGCQLVSRFLDSQNEISSIVRMYTYLSAFNWEPDAEATARIWVPVGDSNGQWVDTENCVLFDKKDLFGLELTVLERYYKHDLLNFFLKVFKVRKSPSIDDYCKLWRDWESNQDGLSLDKCFKFWKYVAKHCNSKNEQTFADAITKVPTLSGSDEVVLFDKRDVFIADDLQLKNLFERKSPHPIFVWYPQPSSLSLPLTRLLEVYKNVGVRNISESIEKVESTIVGGLEIKHVNRNDISIGRGLVRLILGFLADPGKNIEATKRHEIVGCLLNLSVIETEKPVMTHYSLSLTSGEVINGNATQFVRWERESSKLFTQKKVMSGGHKETIEYATYFSEVVSEGVLREYTDYVCALSELIRLAFLLKFDDQAISFIMDSKNLQMFKEDEDFLSSAFTDQSKYV